jgi:hypothetical protein
MISIDEVLLFFINLRGAKRLICNHALLILANDGSKSFSIKFKLGTLPPKGK